MRKFINVQVLSGDGSPFRVIKYSRNAPCRCESGKKQKNCCRVETEFYSSKKIKENIEEQKRKSETESNTQIKQ
jgi:uncharacterized protein YecA (UPF0149 family)